MPEPRPAVPESACPGRWSGCRCVGPGLRHDLQGWFASEQLTGFEVMRLHGEVNAVLPKQKLIDSEGHLEIVTVGIVMAPLCLFK